MGVPSRVGAREAGLDQAPPRPVPESLPKGSSRELEGFNACGQKAGGFYHGLPICPKATYWDCLGRPLRESLHGGYQNRILLDRASSK